MHGPAWVGLFTPVGRFLFLVGTLMRAVAGEFGVRVFVCGLHQAAQVARYARAVGF
jgi:hypothetical protein